MAHRTHKVVAYVRSWARYNAAPYTLRIEDLDPSLFTHLIFAFAGIDESTHELKHLDNYAPANYRNATNLRHRNPNLKVLIAVGGWGEGPHKFANMAASSGNRRRFIKSVVSFLRKYEFDGLDLDWEHPSDARDKSNFTLLVQELREEFSIQSWGWQLTAALGAGLYLIDKAYDIKSISPHLDFMNVMTYDYHSFSNGRVGVNAPLQSQPDKNSVQDTLEHLIRRGAPPKKLMLGLAMYGRIYSGASPARIGSPCTGGFSCPVSRQEGTANYYEVLMLKQQGWVEHWHEATSTPYITNGNQLVSYDNVRSFAMKMDFAKRWGIGGFMCWSVDLDDLTGLFGTKFPLLKQMNN